MGTASNTQGVLATNELVAASFRETRGNAEGAAGDESNQQAATAKDAPEEERDGVQKIARDDYGHDNYGGANDGQGKASASPSNRADEEAGCASRRKDSSSSSCSNSASSESSRSRRRDMSVDSTKESFANESGRRVRARAKQLALESNVPLSPALEVEAEGPEFEVAAPLEGGLLEDVTQQDRDREIALAKFEGRLRQKMQGTGYDATIQGEASIARVARDNNGKGTHSSGADASPGTEAGARVLWSERRWRRGSDQPTRRVPGVALEESRRKTFSGRVQEYYGAEGRGDLSSEETAPRQLSEEEIAAMPIAQVRRLSRAYGTRNLWNNDAGLPWVRRQSSQSIIGCQVQSRLIFGRQGRRSRGESSAGKTGRVGEETLHSELRQTRRSDMLVTTIRGRAHACEDNRGSGEQMRPAGGSQEVEGGRRASRTREGSLASIAEGDRRPSRLSRMAGFYHVSAHLVDEEEGRGDSFLVEAERMDVIGEKRRAATLRVYQGVLCLVVMLVVALSVSLARCSGLW